MYYTCLFWVDSVVGSDDFVFSALIGATGSIPDKANFCRALIFSIGGAIPPIAVNTYNPDLTPL